MKRQKILVSAPYFQPIVERYREHLERAGCDIIVPVVRERLSEEELLGLIGECVGVIAGDDQFTARVIAAAPHLKVISKWGTGIDSFDLESARRAGVAVRNTANAFTDPVADSAMGYILCFARGLPWMSETVKGGVWTKRPGVSLRESTLGIVGVGNIGTAVARRARGFGMTILGCDVRKIGGQVVDEYGLQPVAFEELLERSEFVSLHCDLNPSSRHLFGALEFARMRKEAVIINTARGSIVAEADLVEALRERLIAGAALDVFEVEPLPEGSPLRVMDNVMLAPHNSNSSPSAWERVHESTVRNLLEELQRT